MRDDFNPFQGLLYGLPFSLACWAVVIGVIWLVTR